LPSTPQKFAKVLSGIAAKATPRKRAALDKEGIILTPTKKCRLSLFNDSIGNIIEEMDCKKFQRTKLAIKRRRILASSMLCLKNSQLRKRCDVSWSLALKCSNMEGVWEENKKRNIREKVLQN
jgi:hypothetical protein